MYKEINWQTDTPAPEDAFADCEETHKTKLHLHIALHSNLHPRIVGADKTEEQFSEKK